MTAGELVLREMTWQDVPALAALEPALFADDAWSEQTWWAELAGRPRRCYVVGERGGAVVGYAGVDRRGEVADVMTIAVVPDAQGQGLGSQLMDWLIEEAQRLHLDTVHLDSGLGEDRADAHRLYLNKRMRISAFHFSRPA